MKRRRGWEFVSKRLDFIDAFAGGGFFDELRAQASGKKREGRACTGREITGKLCFSGIFAGILNLSYG